MGVDLSDLLNAQRELHGRMSRAVDNLKKLGSINITPSTVETRVRILDSLWQKFEAQHDLIRAAYKENYESSEYVTTDFFDQTENTYVFQRSQLLAYIKPVATDLSQSDSSRELDPSINQAHKTALPRIKLPQFSGDFKDWPSFRDLFLSVVGENKAVSNIERFHYLRTCLQGQAEKLISPLAITSENYARAWSILTKHFENKRELIRSNFSAFAAVPKMRSESAEELTRVYNAVTAAVNGQESLGRPINSHGMDLFNFLVVEMFDPRTRLEWESATCSSNDPPDHEKVMDFMNKRILTLTAAKPRVAEKPSSSNPRSVKSHFAKQTTESQCPACKGKHTLIACDTFRNKSVSERKKLVESSKVCTNCLGNHALAKCRSFKTCFVCRSRHHTMLHEASVTPKAVEAATEANTLSAIGGAKDRRATLLATARVFAMDEHGAEHPVRVLIDQGSEVSIVSESLVQRLRLRRSRSTVTIHGVGGASTGATRGQVAIEIKSVTTGFELTVVAFVLPRLSLYDGPRSGLDSTWAHVKDLPLADPRYNEADAIELLLGAEVCSEIFKGGFRQGTAQVPMAQETRLGWVLSGGRDSATSPNTHRSFQVTVDEDLTELVRRFFEQEAEVPVSATLTPEEERCEEFFLRTHKRTADGRYIVRLPFASPPTALIDTRKSAARLLTAMEQKGKKDANFRELYRNFMSEYEALGHMEVITQNGPPRTENDKLCYLPHHGVYRNPSATTKLRVVFNGSQRTKSGESLNSRLLVGANLLPSLADVLLRWRWHKFALVTDIEKMYRQIKLHADDQNYQRILWRHNYEEEVHEFCLTTVTYGLACAPFLAIRTLHQLADDEGARYPRGAPALRRDCYVDDILTGTNTLAEARNLQRELRELCSAGGFPLRKWAANDDRILSDVPPEHKLQETSHVWRDNCHSTLGLQWHPRDDCFTFMTHTSTVTTFTKRQVLSQTAKLFDPLGWLSPVIVRAKIWIQAAWTQQLGWDTPLPNTDARNWAEFFAELSMLDRLRIPRWIGCGDENAELELHGFADASEQGYAAVVYLRVTKNHTTELHLLAARTKVAPIKQLSLPRLELCAATLLSNLMHHTRTSLSLFAAPVCPWSDSTIVLGWIQGHPSRWKTYVANRVSHIQRLLPNVQWRHVPGVDNPADCASRGLAPSALLEHPLWWTGPAWLSKDPTHWPSEGNHLHYNDMPEARSIAAAVVRQSNIVRDSELLLRFSCLHKLLRTTAWCLRWRQRLQCANNPPGTSLMLQPEELDNALQALLRQVQGEHYHEELTALTLNRTVSRRSRLAPLSPFLDVNGVLRVGGRLRHAPLLSDERQPMILPSSSRLTFLIIESCHRRTLHGGAQLTLGLIRLRFWIPRGRATVKQVIHRCVTCTRWRATTPQPVMGHLPRGRVTPARPFTHTGVDYAGPIRVRTSKGRGHHATKAFISVFVCLSTRAVHIEVVSDYSTEAFLAAFRRFTSRRGLCSDLYSDCGTNFAGADRALRELFRAASPDGRRMAHAVANEGVRWHFNPPAAPHFGGLWEAAVKSAKHHLRRVIGEATLTFEEMSTLLTQVEACLNSRPLHALSDDPADVTALTPGHFLVGAPLLAVPEPPRTKTVTNTLNRWQLVQRMRDHFWERWRSEYLHALNSRPRWFGKQKNLEIGDLCLIRNETTSPCRWPLARVTGVHPGEDGVVRVVTVRTADSEFTRPSVKIVPLPKDETERAPVTTDETHE